MDDLEESMENTEPPSRIFFLKKIGEDSRLKFLSNKVVEQGITDPAHDMEHLLRVARWTSYIMHKENKENNEQLLPLSIAAALMHDYINLPKNHPERARASQITADAAHQLFLEAGFSKEDATEMATAIRTHSYSRGEIPTTMLGKALQDADRLDALGTLGIFRCISISSQMGSKLFDAADPWSKDREYDDKKFAVDHFFTKLLKLPERMNTEAAKTEANRRANNMIGFLKQLGQEIGADLPSFAEEILE